MEVVTETMIVARSGARIVTEAPIEAQIVAQIAIVPIAAQTATVVTIAAAEVIAGTAARRAKDSADVAAGPIASVDPYPTIARRT
jgi:hypothetical protein